MKDNVDDRLVAAMACMNAMSDRLHILENQNAAYEKHTGCDVNLIAQLEAMEHRLKNARFMVESAERMAFEAKEREEKALKEADIFAREARRLARQIDTQRRRDMLSQLERCQRERELALTDALCKVSCLKSDPEIGLPIGVTKRRNLHKVESRIKLLQEEQTSASTMFLALKNAEDLDNALRTAAAAGNFVTMQTLLDQGARVDAPDEQGASAFDYACGLGSIDGVQICLNAGADPLGASLGIGPLAMVGATRHNLVFAKKNAKSEIEALACAASRPLILAAERGHFDVCKLLLDHSAKTSKALLSTLLQSTDAMGRTPLHAAAARAHITTVRLLLHRGAILDAQDAAKSTPLHAAAANTISETEPVVKMIQLLLASGADSTKRNVSNQTPYQVALKAGRLAVVRAFPPRAASTTMSYASKSCDDDIDTIQNSASLFSADFAVPEIESPTPTTISLPPQKSSKEDWPSSSPSRTGSKNVDVGRSSTSLLRPSWDATPIASLEEQRNALLYQQQQQQQHQNNSSTKLAPCISSH